MRTKTNSLRCEADRQWLKAAFARSFDHSALQNFLHAKATAPFHRRDPDLFGEGTHFRVFRWLPRHNEGISLAIKLAKHEFNDRGEPEYFSRWLERLKKLSRLDVILIPPMEIVHSEDATGLIMPWGDGEFSQAKDYWHPLKERLSEAMARLQEERLQLNDWPQGVSLSGIPFLHDFSDLETV